MTLKCDGCGNTEDGVYIVHNDKQYCFACRKKHEKEVFPDILKSSITCPFCNKTYEFDGWPDIEVCDCGAIVDYRRDDAFRFRKW